jgi:hypothetical protein
MPRLSLLVAAATLAAACAAGAPDRAAAVPACGAGGYSYAGVLGVRSRYGVAARIRPLGAPLVRGGHVAAWVGVGGEGLGPNGSTVWLQAGISAEPVQGSALYYELALPGKDPRYVMLKGHVRLDRSYHVAVLESLHHPGWWRVWVNDTPVTRRLFLPGSHGAWRPTATTESWDGDVGACNSFAFSFRDVRVANRPGGAWAPIQASVLRSPGFQVARRGPSGFVAAAGAAALRVTAGH